MTEEEPPLLVEDKGPRRLSKRKIAWMQFFVIAMVLLGVNILIAPADLGWSEINPSPWILVPGYFGFRFGYKGGIFTSLFVILVVLLGHYMATGLGPLNYMMVEGAYFLWSFLMAGVVTGFIRNLYSRRVELVQLNLNRAESGLKDFVDTLAIYQQNERELKAALVGHGIGVAGIVDGLQHLFTSTSPERLNERFLALLGSHCGVISAGIYEENKRGMFVKEAALRDIPSLPDHLTPGDSPMCQAALESGKLITQAALWDPLAIGVDELHDEGILAIFPNRSLDGKVRRLLLIHRMEFDAISWEGFWRIDSAFGWFENRCRDSLEPDFSDVGVEDINGAKSFATYLIQAVKMGKHLKMESRVILFSPDPEATEDDLRVFAEVLIRSKSRYDVAAIVSVEGHYVFCLLVPLGDDEVAEEYASLILQKMPEMDLDYGVLQLNEALFRTLGFYDELFKNAEIFPQEKKEKIEEPEQPGEPE